MGTFYNTKLFDNVLAVMDKHQCHDKFAAEEIIELCRREFKGGKTMDEKPELKIGDIVHLKSGGPGMTIVGKSDCCACFNCAWFSEDGELDVFGFPAEALEPEIEE